MVLHHHIGRSILISLVLGCAAAHTPAPTPQPTEPAPQPIKTSDIGPWIFAYRSDTIRYQINRSAAVEAQTDSGTRRELSTNNTHEILALSVDSSRVSYRATVDTFSTANQGLIGAVQPVTVPSTISGVLDTASVNDSTAAIEQCDPVRSVLEGDVRNLLINFPAQLAPGTSWRDSTTRVACYGTIPMRAVVVRTFSVVGRTFFNGDTPIAVQRTDSIIAHGEGRQQQHLVAVDASGIGGAVYYLSPERGRVVHLSTTQDLGFKIRASGRTSQFRETVKEEFSPVP